MAEYIGRLIDGRYAVEGSLGSGGMGVVLRARHKFTGAEVALKMLHAELHMDAALESRFLAEARASNQIGHPAIIQVLDAGRTPDGELYLVMELLVGKSLRDAMGQPPAEIRRIASVLLDALGAAHARGFVHRDMKPENVFLVGPEQTVKLLDFGIAKGVKSATIGPPRTAAGVLLGTLAYMAPEQLRDASTVDPRADLWGMGVMIYEMISGHLPFQAYSIEELYMKLARHEPDSIQRWVPTISPVVEQFFARALARDPAARFATAAEMAAAVMQLPLEAQLVVHSQARVGDSGTLATGFGSAPTFASNMPTPVPYAALPSSQAMQTGPQPMVKTSLGDDRPPRGSRAIAVVLLVLAAAAVIVAVVIATRSDSTKRISAITPPIDAAPADATPVAIASIDAAIPLVHRHRDAGVVDAKRPLDAARPIDAGVDAHRAAVIDAGAVVDAAPHLDCIAACGFLDKCGMQRSKCIQECATTNGYNGCLTAVNTDCNKFASCYLAHSCGAVGKGTASCKDTLQCQLACKDRNCVCGCAAKSAPGTIAELVGYNTCLQNCGNDKDCVARSCVAAYNRCK